MFDVVTIGTATRDIFLSSGFFKILKDKKHLARIGMPLGEAQCFALGSKLEIEKPVFAVGGGAANSAVTFSRQGFKTASFFKVGIDGPGESLVGELSEEKLKVFAAKDKTRGTGYSTILISPNGERTILVYRGATEDLTKKDVQARRVKIGWAYIAPSNIHVPVMEAIIDDLFKAGVNIAINPSSKRYLERGLGGLKKIFSKSKVVLFNREEAAYLTGAPFGDEKAIFKKLDAAVPGIAVMTDGARGALVSCGSKIFKAGIFKEKKMADRTGAGDAFGSGFVAGLMRRNKRPRDARDYSDSDIRYALRLASANATSVVERVGATPGILKKSDFDSKRWAKLSIAGVKF